MINQNSEAAEITAEGVRHSADGLTIEWARVFGQAQTGTNKDHGQNIQYNCSKA